MQALTIGGRRPSARRRIAATLAILLGAMTVSGSLLLALNDPSTGLGALSGAAVSSWLTWQGSQRSTTRRIPFFGGAAVVLTLVVVALARRDSHLELILLGACAVATAAAVKVAIGTLGSADGGWTRARALRRPVLLVNPRSGDGKAGRFALADHARARGVQVIVLEPGDDIVALARRAAAEGADALGSAGGDGSLANVAAIAVEHDIPFICVPAGTRNHLALDLGIDREDPIGALDAFTHGIERRIDLADVNGRAFLNNVSLGLYAEAIKRPEYRDAKVRTLLETLNDVASSVAPAPGLSVVDDLGHRSVDPGLVLVSNNPYALNRVLGKGSRPSLNTGRLGVVMLGRRDGGRGVSYRTWNASGLEIVAGGPVQVGADGEAVTLEPPLRFSTHPGALRVRISSRHVGVSPSVRMPLTARSLVPLLVHIAAGRTTGRYAD